MASLINNLNDQEQTRLLKTLSAVKQQYPAINEWLTLLLALQDQKNRKADGNEMYRGQGKATLLSELLETVEKSTDLLRHSGIQG